MTDRSCRTCEHSKEIFMMDYNPPSHRLRCFRDRTMRDGEILDHLSVGSDCAMETDSLPEPHRVPGDKCGKDRMHWQGVVKI